MKRLWNVYKYINSFSKTEFCWPQGANCTWKFSKNFSALVAFQNRPRASLWRKQVWIPRRTISWWKASLPPQKENWAFFELPLSIFCLLRVYLNLKMQNSGFKTATWWSRGSHFVENGYPSRMFPNMVKVNIHEHWTQDRQSIVRHTFWQTYTGSLIVSCLLPFIPKVLNPRVSHRHPLISISAKRFSNSKEFLTKIRNPYYAQSEDGKCRLRASTAWKPMYIFWLDLSEFLVCNYVTRWPCWGSKQ